MSSEISRATIVVLAIACSIAIDTPCLRAQTKTADNQINVNWLYGSYVPKDVPLRSLSGRERLKLYVRQTYTTPGIYIKTTLFALRDQIADSQPE